MSQPELTEWLKNNGLEAYIDTFVKEHIDLQSLSDLSDDQLKELGVSMGHRIKLKKALESLNTTNSTEPKAVEGQQSSSQPQVPTRSASKLTSKPPKEEAKSQPKPSPVSVTPSSEKMREYVIKVIVVGEIGTGKTSLIQRYTSGTFDKGYKATIGVDFCLKELELDNTKMVSLQLWDIAGQERFANLTRMYYKEARGAFVVFDLTRQKTYDAALKWKQDIDSKVTLPSGKVIPVILLANKCDVLETVGPDDWSKTLDLDKFCRDNGFLKGFYTSAKEDIGINEATDFLVREIIETDELKSSSLNFEKAGLNVRGAKPQTSSKGSSPSCCA